MSSKTPRNVETEPRVSSLNINATPFYPSRANQPIHDSSHVLPRSISDSQLNHPRIVNHALPYIEPSPHGMLFSANLPSMEPSPQGMLFRMALPFMGPSPQGMLFPMTIPSTQPIPQGMLFPMTIPYTHLIPHSMLLPMTLPEPSPQGMSMTAPNFILGPTSSYVTFFDQASGTWYIQPGVSHLLPSRGHFNRE